MRRKKRAGVMVGTELAEKQAVDTREQILVGQKKTNESWFLGSHFLLWRNEWGANLTSIAGSGIFSNFTSTLQVTASRMFARSDTTVECRNQPGVNMSSRFTVAGNSGDSCLPPDSKTVYCIYYNY